MTKTSDPDDAQISEEENVDLDFHEEFKPIEINVDQAQSKPNIIMPLEIMNSQLENVPVVEAKNANSDIDLQISGTEGDINVSLDFLEELKPIKIIVNQDLLEEDEQTKAVNEAKGGILLLRRQDFRLF